MIGILGNVAPVRERIMRTGEDAPTPDKRFRYGSIIETDIT
ncbi:hypothetical protein [Ruminococcus sp. YRD2003]